MQAEGRPRGGASPHRGSAAEAEPAARPLCGGAGTAAEAWEADGGEEGLGGARGDASAGGAAGRAARVRLRGPREGAAIFPPGQRGHGAASLGGICLRRAPLLPLRGSHCTRAGREEGQGSEKCGSAERATFKGL